MPYRERLETQFAFTLVPLQFDLLTEALKLLSENSEISDNHVSSNLIVTVLAGSSYLIGRHANGSSSAGEAGIRDSGQGIGMWYTYNLWSLKSGRLYTGATDDLRRRFREHNSKRGGKYTADNAPFVLVHYKAFLAKSEALKQEKFYKSGYGKEVLKEKIAESLKKLSVRE